MASLHARLKAKQRDARRKRSHLLRSLFMSGPAGADGGVSEGAAAVLDGMDDGVDVGVPFEPMDESSSEDDDDDDDSDDSITANESGSEVSDDDDNEGEGEGYGDSDDDGNDSDECSSEMELASNVDENREIVRTTSPLGEDRDDDAADRAAEHAELEEGPPEHCWGPD